MRQPKRKQAFQPLSSMRFFPSSLAPDKSCCINSYSDLFQKVFYKIHLKSSNVNEAFQ